MCVWYVVNHCRNTYAAEKLARWPKSSQHMDSGPWATAKARLQMLAALHGGGYGVIRAALGQVRSQRTLVYDSVAVLESRPGGFFLISLTAFCYGHV